MRMTSSDPEPHTNRHAPRALLAVLLLAGAALAVPLPHDGALFESAQAQVLDDCDSVPLLFECDFELELTQWPETGIPGETLTGTVTITNTGDGLDSYTITVSTDNETWNASVDPAETEDVEEDATATINVTVEIPADAGLGDTAEINVTVTSQNDEEVTDSLIFDAISGQVFDWTLGCDDAVTIRTGSQGTVTLAAFNAGNGADQATVTAMLPTGVQAGTIDAFDLEAGEAEERIVTVEVAGDVEEGDHTIEWQLQSAGAQEATESCITSLSATSEDVPDDGDPEEEDNPLPVVLLLIVALAAAVIARRHRQEKA